MEVAINILSALLGAGLFSFLQFLIQRKDKISEKLENINLTQKDIQLNLCRLQLLNLVQHEGSQHETLLVAERYFKELEGDWYMTPLFCKWLEEHELEKPNWFTQKN